MWCCLQPSMVYCFTLQLSVAKRKKIIWIQLLSNKSLSATKQATSLYFVGWKSINTSFCRFLFIRTWRFASPGPGDLKQARLNCFEREWETPGRAFQAYFCFLSLNEHLKSLHKCMGPPCCYIMNPRPLKFFPERTPLYLTTPLFWSFPRYF